ncbi:hypothetical protein B566_EDAN010467 [Ephemera danica]|nr:hypothetical protein B566_EDAN010467 [Ephemera danica]
MEDIFHWTREGNAIQVRLWLDDTEHDMNQGDDHGFSPLHWAAKEGHTKLVEMLMQRGARVGATNRGDDTPLHLAAAHGHRDIVHMLLRQRADINFTNEHGNTALHYACFWGYDAIAEDLVAQGALVVVDTAQALRLALGVARGMAFLHNIEHCSGGITTHSPSWIVFTFCQVDPYLHE